MQRKSIRLFVSFVLLVGATIPAVADWVTPTSLQEFSYGDDIDFEYRTGDRNPTNGDPLQAGNCTLELYDQTTALETIPMDFDWMVDAGQYKFYNDPDESKVQYPNIH